jgi:hypothetical protein
LNELLRDELREWLWLRDEFDDPPPLTIEACDDGASVAWELAEDEPLEAELAIEDEAILEPEVPDDGAEVNEDEPEVADDEPALEDGAEVADDVPWLDAGAWLVLLLLLLLV